MTPKVTCIAHACARRYSYDAAAGGEGGEVGSSNSSASNNNAPQPQPQPQPQSNDDDVPVFDGISLQHVTGLHCTSAGDISGLPDVSVISNLLLRNVSISGALLHAMQWSECSAAQGRALQVQPQPPCLLPN